MLRPENNQVINLTTRYTWSGCMVRTRARPDQSTSDTIVLLADVDASILVSYARFGSVKQFLLLLMLKLLFHFLLTNRKWNSIPSERLLLLMLPVQQRDPSPLGLLRPSAFSNKQLDVLFSLLQASCLEGGIYLLHSSPTRLR